MQHTLDPTAALTHHKPWGVVTESYDSNGVVTWRKTDLFTTHAEADTVRKVRERYAEQFVDRSVVILMGKDLGQITVTHYEGQLAKRDMTTRKEALSLAFSALAMGLIVGVVTMWIATL